jgi:HAD superfamily hydrolase (TIGR01490 family)
VTTLALFDLDHTLIPFDSGMAWTQWLVQRGHLPPEAEARYLAFCHDYVAGTLDIHAMHHANLAPLAPHSPQTLQAWAQEFESHIRPQVPASRRALVQQHLDAGHLCAIVTATTRLVAEPLARVFGLQHLVATEAEQVDGRYTGAVAGEPCFREGKPRRVNTWLRQLGFDAGLQAFDASWFYSDSASDLPLLQAVTNPVAVCPDERLGAHAFAAGWAIWQER